MRVYVSTHCLTLSLCTVRTQRERARARAARMNFEKEIEICAALRLLEPAVEDPMERENLKKNMVVVSVLRC